MEKNLKYRYETHAHTYPVSKCAKTSVYDTLMFYKKMNYAGVFITNHFIGGNINMDSNADYKDLVDFYFSDYEEAVKLGNEIGIDVFCGVELSNKGTDFLIYGLDKEWFLSHPEIMDMKKSEELSFMAEQGALIIQAHPYREASYIDHIRLYPRHVHGVEIYNGGCDGHTNEMAKLYAEHYSLIAVAGSDFHGRVKDLMYGIETDKSIKNEADYKRVVLNQEFRCFSQEVEVQ